MYTILKKREMSIIPSTGSLLTTNMQEIRLNLMYFRKQTYLFILSTICDNFYALTFWHIKNIGVFTFAGLWNDDDDLQPKPKHTPKKIDPDYDSGNDNFLEDTINRPPVELPEIPILNITSSAVRAGVTSTEWAEMIDVSQPVPDFREKIKDMAHSFPFELDNFQKQVYANYISHHIIRLPKINV